MTRRTLLKTLAALPFVCSAIKAMGSKKVITPLPKPVLPMANPRYVRMKFYVCGPTQTQMTTLQGSVDNKRWFDMPSAGTVTIDGEQYVFEMNNHAKQSE